MERKGLGMRPNSLLALVKRTTVAFALLTVNRIRFRLFAFNEDCFAHIFLPFFVVKREYSRTQLGCQELFFTVTLT